MPKNKASLVYSSESGSVCPECEQPLDACYCNPSANPKDGLKTVRVSFEHQRQERQVGHLDQRIENESQ